MSQLSAFGFELLALIKENPRMQHIAILNQLLPAHPPKETENFISQLVSDKLLKDHAGISGPLESCYSITPAGEALLAAYREECGKAAQKKADDEAREAVRLQERLEDHANEERRYRTQNKIAIVMPLVTFLLGLITEHFWGILAAFLQIFS